MSNIKKLTNNMTTTEKLVDYFVHRILGVKKHPLPLLVEQQDNKVKYGKYYTYYGVRMKACKHTCSRIDCNKCDAPMTNRDLLKRFPERKTDKHFKHCSECCICAIKRRDWPCRCFFQNGICQGHFEE